MQWTQNTLKYQSRARRLAMSPLKGELEGKGVVLKGLVQAEAEPLKEPALVSPQNR